MESISIRWVVGLTTLAAISALLLLFDAPELTFIRWTVGLTAWAVILALLLFTDRSESTSPRWVTGLIILLAALSALLASSVVVMATGDWVPDPWWVPAVVGGATFAASIAGVLVAAKRWRGRIVPVLKLLLTTTVGMLGFLLLLPWECDDMLPPACWSVFGGRVPTDDLLFAIPAGLLTAGLTWLLVGGVDGKRG